VRIIARFEKGNSARFVSHLDVQRLFQRAFRRASVPAAYSQGFNPHQVLAFATALSVGFTSSAEWLDLRLEKEIELESFVERVNAVLPNGFRVLEAVLGEDTLPALSALMCAADYTVRLGAEVNAQALDEAVHALLSGEIVVNKKTKAGMKDIDIRPQIYRFEFQEPDKLLITGEVSAQGSLNVDLLMEALFARVNREHPYTVHRDMLYSKDGRIMPQYDA
jgi:radical SAM-linked protein